MSEAATHAESMTYSKMYFNTSKIKLFFNCIIGIGGKKLYIIPSEQTPAPAPTPSIAPAPAPALIPASAPGV